MNHHRVYWFCRHCWQEMPDLATTKYNSSQDYSLIDEFLNIQKSRTLVLK
jgi:hypothetical protein